MRRAARIRPVTRSTMASSVASISSAECRWANPRARCEPIDPRRVPVRTWRGSRLLASACRCRADAFPTIAASVDSPSMASSPTVRMPRSRSFTDVFGPTPHSRSIGSGCRKSSSPPERHDEQAVGLGRRARHLGQELGSRRPDRDRQPDRRPDLGPQVPGDVDRRPADPPEAADVEERLVDRDALDERRGPLEHLEHRLAGLGVGRHPGRDDDQVGAEPPGEAPAHRPAHAVRLGLVAGGEDDAAADRDRPAPQRRVVALLDGREEAVQVRMKDRRQLRRRITSHRTHVRTR